MAVRGGMYNANKRKKEIARKKKQDEKRLKRQKNTDVQLQNPEEVDSIIVEPESTEDTPELKEE